MILIMQIEPRITSVTHEHDYAIDVSHLSFSYGNDTVLDDVSFSVLPQTLCALVGPNGSGKSTLVKCITGLLTPDSGHADVHCAHDHRGHSIGYVPQRHFLSGEFPLSVFEAVSTGRVAGNKRWFRLSHNDREKITHAIEAVGLSEHTRCRVDELSGGQQQRVLIAKAFASEPDVLILDEPTAGVDAASQDLFRDALDHIISEHNTTVLLVSHDLSSVASLVDHIVVLKNRVLFDGKPEELARQGVSLGLHEHDLPHWLERLHETDLHEEEMS
jgi:zinc transport system ATP-binding protein